MANKWYQDKEGNTSSKRIAGMGLVIAGVVGAFMAIDSEAVQWLLLSGVGALGVGTFETKVQK